MNEKTRIYYFDAEKLGRHLGAIESANDKMSIEASTNQKKEDMLFHKGIAEGLKMAQEVIVRHMTIDEQQVALDSFMQGHKNQGSV